MEVFLSLFIGLIAGVAGGFFGIGGAVLIIPLLVGIFGFDQHLAQGTSVMALLPPIGLLAAMKYYQQGNVKVAIGLLVALGFLFGGFIGAHYAHKLHPEMMKKAFGVFLFFVSIKMIFFK